MAQYVPLSLDSTSLDGLANSVYAEMQRIADAFDALHHNVVAVEELHVEPDKKPSDLVLVAAADGTDWDPGSGQGLYAYFGGAWNAAALAAVGEPNQNAFSIVTGDVGTANADAKTDTLNIAGGVAINTTAAETPDSLTIDVDITGLTADTTAAGTDLLLIDDGAHKKITKDNFLAVGSELQAWDTLLDSISALSDPAADRILFWDNSGSAFNWLSPGSGISITLTSVDIDHDAANNFVADEHVAHSSVTLTAGAGLTGGGDISASRTFDVGAGDGITVAADSVAVDITGSTDKVAPVTGDELLLADSAAAGAIKKSDIAAIVNLADHDVLTNFVADEHVAHSSVTITAGAGLTGGGDISATRTLDVGAGDGIAVAADSVAVNITGATDKVAPVTGDELLLADSAAAGAIKKSDIAAIVNLADHDVLTNFVADEHIAHSSVTITAGTGLSGGGNIASSFSLDVDLNELTTEVSIAAGDFIAMVDITDSGSGKITFANFEATLNHDSLAGVTADEHIAHSGVTITAGTGLSGGGNIASSFSLDVDLNELTTETTIAAGDFLAMVDITDSGSGKITFANLEAALNHDSLTGFVADEHVAHSGVTITAGSGLTGGGDISATRTLNVGAGDGIAVAADSVAVDITNATDKPTPLNTDEILIADSAAAGAIKKADIQSIVDAGGGGGGGGGGVTLTPPLFADPFYKDNTLGLPIDAFLVGNLEDGETVVADGDRLVGAKLYPSASSEGFKVIGRGKTRGENILVIRDLSKDVLVYRMFINGQVGSAASSDHLSLEVSTDNGGTFITDTDYDFLHHRRRISGTTENNLLYGTEGASAVGEMRLNRDHHNSTVPQSWEIYFYDPMNADQSFQVLSDHLGRTWSNQFGFCRTWAQYQIAVPINAFSLQAYQNGALYFDWVLEAMYK